MFRAAAREGHRPRTSCMSACRVHDSGAACTRGSADARLASSKCSVRRRGAWPRSVSCGILRIKVFQAQRIELSDESSGVARLAGAFDEVVRAKIAVSHVVGEHVPDGNQNRVLHRDEGPLAPAAGHDSSVPRGQVGVLAARRRSRPARARI